MLLDHLNTFFLHLHRLLLKTYGLVHLSIQISIVNKNSVILFFYKYCIKIGGVIKLVPNLGNKSKHVLHYRNLQLYLSLGMKLVKVQRILKIKQSDWLKVRLVNNTKDYKKYVSKPSFVSQKIFCKNFVAIHEIKPVLTVDQPIYVGFSILDLSRFLMYEFHCKYI